MCCQPSFHHLVRVRSTTAGRHSYRGRSVRPFSRALRARHLYCSHLRHLRRRHWPDRGIGQLVVVGRIRGGGCGLFSFVHATVAGQLVGRLATMIGRQPRLLVALSFVVRSPRRRRQVSFRHNISMECIGSLGLTNGSDTASINVDRPAPDDSRRDTWGRCPPPRPPRTALRSVPAAPGACASTERDTRTMGKASLLFRVRKNERRHSDDCVMRALVVETRRRKICSGLQRPRFHHQ
jgi:hypothetical protein